MENITVTQTTGGGAILPIMLFGDHSSTINLIRLDITADSQGKEVWGTLTGDITPTGNVIRVHIPWDRIDIFVNKMYIKIYAEDEEIGLIRNEVFTDTDRIQEARICPWGWVQLSAYEIHLWQ